MNFNRAMMSAADCCEVYLNMHAEGETPATMTFVDDQLVWAGNGDPVVVTKDMLSGDFLVWKKWRRTAEAKALQMLKDGHGVRVHAAEGGTEDVVLVDNVVKFKTDGSTVPTMVGREWLVLR